jgi:adenosyl cobinamide kinase/adenosyl cobinamide phosphate guanylyltransferase
MHLIFGGAYQGKRDYAKERYGLKDEEISTCIADGRDGLPESAVIDFSGKAVDRLEEFVLYCVRCGIEAADYLNQHSEEWKHSIIICTDISSGVVPVDKELRAWREMVGRTMMYLGKEAEEVTRMFCGIPQKIK